MAEQAVLEQAAPAAEAGDGGGESEAWSAQDIRDAMAGRKEFPADKPAAPSLRQKAGVAEPSLTEIGRAIAEGKEPEEEAPAADEEADPAEAEPETDEEPTAEAPDYSWLPQDLHGVPIKDVITALQSGKLPDALADAITLQLKDGDDEWDAPVSEARRAAMRAGNYTKKLQEHARNVESVKRREQTIETIAAAWGDETGKGIYDSMRRLGLQKQFFEAAKMLAEEHQRLGAMPPDVREAYEEAQRMRDDAERERQELMQLRAERDRGQNNASVEKHTEYLARRFPLAFRAHGLVVTPYTQKLAAQNLQVIWESNGGGDFTDEMVSEAVRATKEIVGEQQAAAAPAAAQPVQSPARVQAAQAAARPAPAASPAKPAIGARAYDPAKPAAAAPKQASAAQLREMLKKGHW